MTLYRASGESGCSLYVGYESPSRQFLVSISRPNAVPKWATYASPVPTTVKRVEEIWREIKEREICTFFRHKMDVWKIVVGSRRAVWDSLDDRLLPHKRDDFREIEVEEARQLADNEDEWQAMLGELRALGITCRAC